MEAEEPDVIEISENDYESEEESDEEDVIVKDQLNRIPDNERTTYNRLTKYEKTRILTVRMEQLAQGSPAMVEVNKDMTIKDIAIMELKLRKIPLIIRRKVKGNKFEQWKLSELIY
jgi:DNA-directed RNA polymerase subunit K/omega